MISVSAIAPCCGSSDQDFRIAGELVGGKIEVARRRPLPDASGCVVDRAVAWAEPAVIGALMAERHAPKMRADADHDQPFRLLHARLICGGIRKLGEGRVLRLLDLFLRTVAHKNWIAAP